jgi:hypothetical protein
MLVLPTAVHNFRSNAERKVFDALRATDLGPGAFAVHSLNLAKHEYKRWSELDFIVAWDEGAFVLEIKGGRVACSDGVWTFTNRFGESHRKSEGPFDQAKSGHDALRTAVVAQSGQSDLRSICWGWGVMFPDIEFEQASVSWAPELIASQWDIASPGSLGQYLRRLARWWRSRGRGHHSLADQADLVMLRNAIRPDFDKIPTIAVSIDQAVESAVRLTQEQLEILDSVEENNRLICSGGAGTGKSFLAAEAARREAAANRSVLLLCRSAIFASFLRSRVGDSNIVVAEFAEVGAFLNRGAQFDCVVIDEAQDLLTGQAISQVGMVLRDGIEDGRWRMFMDPNNQSGLHEPIDADLLASLKRCAAIHKLKRNCRNTQQIVLQTQLVTGADIGVAEIEGAGPPIEFASVDDARNEVQALARKLTQWLDSGVRPGSITVLSPRPFRDSVASQLPANVSTQIAVVDPRVAAKWPPRTITFSGIRDFKGLENRCVAVVDLDELFRSAVDIAQLYVAMTRAHAGLWLAVSTVARERIDRLVYAHTRKILGKVGDRGLEGMH